MFEKINLIISNPDKSKELAVEINKILTVSQIANELVRNDFVSSAYNYGLLIESDGRVLSQDSTLTSVEDATTVRVVAFSERPIVNGHKINVTILHPSNGSDLEVELNDGLTVHDVINELIACSFVEDSENANNYRLFIKNSQT